MQVPSAKSAYKIPLLQSLIVAHTHSYSLAPVRVYAIRLKRRCLAVVLVPTDCCSPKTKELVLQGLIPGDQKCAFNRRDRCDFNTQLGYLSRTMVLSSKFVPTAVVLAKAYFRQKTDVSSPGALRLHSWAQFHHIATGGVDQSGIVNRSSKHLQTQILG